MCMRRFVLAWICVLLLLAPLSGLAEAKRPVRVAAPPPGLLAQISGEAAFIRSTQFLSPGHPADGAFNDVPGAPTWVVPREMGVAMLGLLRVANAVGGEEAAADRAAVERAADYLVRVQRADGSWADQYDHAVVVVASSSPTQTAEVMIALGQAKPTPQRVEAIRRGADWLLAAASPANKTGPYADDGLVNAGMAADGSWNKGWRWASDNAFAQKALDVAAVATGDAKYARAATRIREGLNTMRDPATPTWWRHVDGAHQPSAEPADWIQYAPAFVLAVRPNATLGQWVDGTLGRAGGAVAWESRDGPDAGRLSPGYAFQACVIWRASGMGARCDAAIAWADASGLHDANGGWIDWTEPATGARAPSWQRFIDTSAYAIAARLGESPFDPPGTKL